MTPQDPLAAKVSRARPAIEVSHRFESWLRLWLPLKYELTVRFTHNRSTCLSFKRDNTHVHLRLHHLFMQAGPDIAQAICLYVTCESAQSKAHAQALKRFVGTLQHAPPEGSAPLPAVRHQGQVHNLQLLYDRLNKQQFAGRCQAAITWGRASAQPSRRRSITLGSYTSAQQLIRIHPCLDQSFVPEYVVQGVVHHEMLHEIIGVEERAGRRRIHPPQFVAQERAYADYGRCVAWERANIRRLLAYRP